MDTWQTWHEPVLRLGSYLLCKFSLIKYTASPTSLRQGTNMAGANHPLSVSMNTYDKMQKGHRHRHVYSPHMCTKYRKDMCMRTECTYISRQNTCVWRKHAYCVHLRHRPSDGRCILYSVHLYNVGRSEILGDI